MWRLSIIRGTLVNFYMTAPFSWGHEPPFIYFSPVPATVHRRMSEISLMFLWVNIENTLDQIDVEEEMFDCEKYDKGGAQNFTEVKSYFVKLFGFTALLCDKLIHKL